MAEEEIVPERKEQTERRVYNLPAALLARLRSYQVSHGIASEAEAARRLLDTALQMKDSIDDVLEGLAAKFQEERDLRVLAAEILAKHALVTSIEIDDASLSFRMRSGQRGQIASTGRLYSAEAHDSADDWTGYTKRSDRSKRKAPSWDTPRGGDLDDDIPF